ncbi:MAG: hypothetical protein K5663_06505 [Clostridiales bacterium]|nr:hypothetical protein [Clostridiales bacterium]
MAKQNIQKINEWKAANVTRINLEFRNDTHIAERISKAVEMGKAKSRQAYILDAIKKALDADGIPTLEDGNE